MEESLWNNFPEVLLLNVLVFLPVGSLLKFRSVCKRWNSIVDDQEFREFREFRARKQVPFYQEFVQHVQRCPRFENLSIVNCVRGFILMTNVHCQDMYVIEPSIVYVKQIPCLGFTQSPMRSERYTVGMVLHPGTRNYSIFVASKDIQLRSIGKTPISVHSYDSDTGVWRALGAITPPQLERYPTLQGVMLYRGNHLILVRTRTQIRQRSYRYRVMLYEEESQTWERLPGGFPPFEYKSPLLFNHDDRLLLAILFLNGCYIWEYQEQTSTWVLFDHLLKAFFTSEEMTEMRDPVHRSRRQDLYRQMDGDFLYFGRWSVTDGELPSVMMRYNLVDRRWDDMPLEEAAHTLVSRPRDGRRFFYRTSSSS